MRYLGWLALIVAVGGCRWIAPYSARPATDGGGPSLYQVELTLGSDGPVVHGDCRPLTLVVRDMVDSGPARDEPASIQLAVEPAEGAIYAGSACNDRDRVDEVPYASGSSTLYFKVEPNDPRALTQTVALVASLADQQADAAQLVVSSRAPAQAVAVGNGHSCATVAHTVQCWGGNDQGQLGDGTRTSRAAPEAIRWPNAIGAPSSVAANAHHACAVVGEVAYCWGLNQAGQIGDGASKEDLETRTRPVAVVGLDEPVHQVVVGLSHSCAIQGGGVFCWGTDWAGQLGSQQWGASSSTPVAVTGLQEGVTQLSAGNAHTCALRGTELWCWGNNEAGQLAQDPEVNPVSWEPVKVSIPNGGVPTGVGAGRAHGCAVVDGGVMCWGRNGNGQLGDGTTTTRHQPQWVSGLEENASVVSVALGHDHSCATKASGQLFCWGANDHGQLGPTGTVEQTSAVLVESLSGVTSVAASAGHTCVVARGLVRCLGRADSGQLGAMNPQVASEPRLVAGLESVSSGDGGEGFSCAVTGTGSSSKLSCWGRNKDGQLGDGSNTTRAVPQTMTGLAGVALVTTGTTHTCAAVAQPPQVYCWGENYAGQLGSGDKTPSAEPVVVGGLGDRELAALSTFDRHTCALVPGGEVVGGYRCWGFNGSGQLGDGSTDNGYVALAVDISALNASGGGPATLGSVVSGQDHVCAVASGGVACWGDNSRGQCGVLAGSDILRPTGFHPSFPADANVKSVASGGQFSCALQGGQVRCWGKNWSGELGGSSYVSSHEPFTVVGPANSPLTSIAQVVAGNAHACARDQGGSVYCWGANASGQLGNGMRTSSNKAVLVDGLSPAEHVFVGHDHSCAVVSETRRLWCWGSNAWGALAQPWVPRVDPQAIAPWSSGLAL